MTLSKTKKTSTQHKGHNSENIGVIVGCWKKHSQLPQKGQCNGLIRMVWMTSPSLSKESSAHIFQNQNFQSLFRFFSHWNDIWICISGSKAIWIYNLIVFWFLPKKPLTNFFWPNKSNLWDQVQAIKIFQVWGSPIIKGVTGAKDTFIIFTGNNRRNFLMKGQNLRFRENFNFDICFNRCG